MNLPHTTNIIKIKEHLDTKIPMTNPYSHQVMNFPTLASYKEARKHYGTIGSMYWFASKTSMDETTADASIDRIASDLGSRRLEKMKSKHLYDLMDGLCLAYEEHFVPTAN